MTGGWKRQFRDIVTPFFSITERNQGQQRFVAMRPFWTLLILVPMYAIRRDLSERLFSARAVLWVTRETQIGSGIIYTQQMSFGILFTVITMR